METVTLKKKERKPLAIRRVELKKGPAAQAATPGKAPEEKITKEFYKRPNYLLRLL